MGKRFVQGFAVLGLVATLMLAVASFVFGQIRADDLRIAEIEQQNIAATEEHRQATEQSRILACRFEGRQDCDQLTATSSAPQLQEVPERSGPGQLGTQVLLGISLWGAVAIAGTGLVPALSLVAYVLYRLIRGLLFPLLLASFLLDMVLRLVGGIVTFAGHTGHTVFQVSHRLGELEVQAAKGVANAGSAVVGRLRERPAAPEPTERNGVHQPGLSANSNGHEPETPELVDLVGGHPPQ